ncbi:hypothetical protein L2E82_39338 [Cichorium intybus]|uniref:Uncharacterized protein n=1 Tax=Cichorium intybus TaxID=13427 RepID=A0ACB9AI71_CICIN|nr:hypothetical protein L2E82_39338 [Cichorium intybus]
MSSLGNVSHLSHPCVYDTDRKSLIMKWLTKLLKGGPSVGSGGGGSPQFIGDESLILRAPVRSLDNRTRSEKEKEELDRPIALSLAQGLNKANGYGWQPGNGNDPAKNKSR